MPALRALVRYGYAPFMMLGLTGAAYWVVAELVVAQATPGPICCSSPLLAVAYVTAFGAERIAPFFDDWNDHDAHGDTRPTSSTSSSTSTRRSSACC